MKQLGDNNYSPTLSPVQINALEASQNTKIKAITKLNILTALKKAIQSAYLSLSQKPNDVKTLVPMINELIEELKQYYVTYTIEEICMAIDFGVKGKLNDITKIPQPIISTTNILKWIDLYNEIHRKNALHEQNQYEIKQAKILSEEQLAIGNRITEDSINNTYIYFLKHDQFPIDGIMSTGLKAAWYRYLDKKQMVKIYLSSEEKLKIKIAVDLFIKSFDELPLPEKQALRPKGRREEWERYRAIEVVNECHSLALEEIFKKAKIRELKFFFGPYV